MEEDLELRTFQSSRYSIAETNNGQGWRDEIEMGTEEGEDYTEISDEDQVLFVNGDYCGHETGGGGPTDCFASRHEVWVTENCNWRNAC